MEYSEIQQALGATNLGWLRSERVKFNLTRVNDTPPMGSGDTAD